jgi:hypothetical protein
MRSGGGGGVPLHKKCSRPVWQDVHSEKRVEHVSRHQWRRHRLAHCGHVLILAMKNSSMYNDSSYFSAVDPERFSHYGKAADSRLLYIVYIVYIVRVKINIPQRQRGRQAPGLGRLAARVFRCRCPHIAGPLKTGRQTGARPQPSGWHSAIPRVPGGSRAMRVVTSRTASPGGSRSAEGWTTVAGLQGAETCSRVVSMKRELSVVYLPTVGMHIFR